MTIGGNNAQHPRCDARASVSPGLALHEDKLNVVFHDCVWLIRFAEKPAAVSFRLVDRVRDLVPDDWSEIAESDLPAVLLDRGVQGNDGVLAAVFAPGEAHIPHHTNQPAAGYKGVVAALPHTVEFSKKLLIIRDVAHLIRMLAVVLQRPVRRGRHDQMNAVGRKKVDVPGIVAVELVPGWNLRQPVLDRGDRFWILRNPRQVSLMVGDFPDFRGEPIRRVKDLGLGGPGLGSRFRCLCTGAHVLILRLPT